MGSLTDNDPADGPWATESWVLPVEDAYPEPLRAPFAVFDGFRPAQEAEAMRGHVDAHFARPHAQRAETHQIWNYWYVPGLYTYLRTEPERVIPHDLVAGFHDALREWASERLGLAHVSWPVLSLYVDGCGQTIHNDSANGRFGYVYSLTRDHRQSRGGETLIFKEGDPFRSRLSEADAGQGLYDLVPPLFNRLVIFDDRMPHSVQRIEGSMDPLDGRFVLHGHISEESPIVRGPLPPETVHAALGPVLKASLDAFADTEHLHHGPLTIRIEIAPDGRVADCRVLVDRVARRDGGSPEALVARIVGAFSTTRFPRADAVTTAILPILTGGLLPLAAERMGG